MNDTATTSLNAAFLRQRGHLEARMAVSGLSEALTQAVAAATDPLRRAAARRGDFVGEVQAILECARTAGKYGRCPAAWFTAAMRRGRW